MTRFARRIPGLQETFPSSSREAAAPSEVSELVQLVHPWPGRLFRLENLTVVTFTSPAALSPAVGSGVVPQGFTDEWVFAEISHTDAAATRHIVMDAVEPGPGVSVRIARFMVAPTGAAPGAERQPVFAYTNVSMPSGARSWPPYRIVVPPGWEISILGETAGAAYQVQMVLARLRRPITEDVRW